MLGVDVLDDRPAFGDRQQPNAQLAKLLGVRERRPDRAQEHLAKHFAKNVADVEEVTRSRLLTPITVSRNAEVETPALSPEMFDGEDMDSLGDQVEHLHELMAALNEEVAAAKETGFSEERIQEIVRDEIENYHTNTEATNQNS